EIKGEFSEELANKSVIVPLPVFPYNEQQYGDVLHIVGDQLAREIFSGAKGLHQGAFDARERLRDLYPITFELWHTAMNYLTMAYQKLFSVDSFETGSMNGERIHIRRHDVNADNIPPDPMTDLWLQQTMYHFIELYVFSGHNIHTIAVHIKQWNILLKGPKKMLEGLGPMNKDKSLLARSKAAAAMDNIVDNFDSISDVKVRAGYHKERNSLKQFVHSGRFFSAHKNIQASADSVNRLEFESWINDHKVRLEFESGK
ncbi:hypothetical protein ACJMK2_026332, partial [Sinanodonta woodiana]